MDSPDPKRDELQVVVNRTFATKPSELYLLDGLSGVDTPLR